MKDGRLEVSDLMIGDWVDANGHKEVVEQIERSALKTNNWAYDWKESVIKPIPLTKEILEKNGFKVTEDGCTSWRLDIGSTLIKICGTYDYHLSINIPTNTSAHGFRWLLYDLTIFYVHQLQQAMRIFRINKKIEL